MPRHRQTATHYRKPNIANTHPGSSQFLFKSRKCLSIHLSTFITRLIIYVWWINHYVIPLLLLCGLVTGAANNAVSSPVQTGCVRTRGLTIKKNH